MSGDTPYSLFCDLLGNIRKYNGENCKIGARVSLATRILIQIAHVGEHSQ